jgi:hypothetical protein
MIKHMKHFENPPLIFKVIEGHSSSNLLPTWAGG